MGNKEPIKLEGVGTLDKFVKYSFQPDDVGRGENKRFGKKRVATPPDQSLRAGFARLLPGQEIRPWVFWYKELWYVIAGTAELKVHDKRTGEKQTIEIKPKDVLYYPEGVRVELVNTGSEDLFLFYCAVPASNRYASWLPFLEEEDIAAIRSRKGD